METREEHRKKVKKRKFKYLNILGLISIIVFGVFVYYLTQIDVLSTLYFTIIVLVCSIFQVLSIILINLKKKVWKWIGSIILVISIIINGVGIYYLHNTNEFLKKSLGSKIVKTTNTYYVVANKENNFTDDNIEGEITYFDKTPKIKKAIKEFQEVYTDTTMKKNDDVISMYKDIKDKKSNFMLVEKLSYNTTFDLEKDLKKEDFKIVDKIKVVTESKIKKASTDKFNIYIAGTDFTDECMDFNMLVTVNTKTNRIVMTSIPRDFYFEVVGTGGAKDKLSFMAPYGIDTMKSSLENLFGINIDYYFKINTTSLVDVVDQVGGITFCSDYDYITTHATVLDTYDDRKGKKLHVTKGCQEVNGIQALTIARERLKLPGGDRARQENCRKILLAIVDKLKSTNTVTNYTNLLNSFSNLYETSVPKQAFSKIAKKTVDNGGKWRIDEQKVDGNDGNDYVHLSRLTDYVMRPNMDTVKEAAKKINRVINH